MELNDTILLFPLWYVVFLLSLTCHEAAHAFAAYRGGDPTAYLEGQVTLNPVPHMRREPFGTVLVPILTYFMAGWTIGWASAPYDPLWEDRHPRRAAIMAAAGPAANFVLFLIAFVALRVGLSNGVWGVPYDEVSIDRIVVPLAADAGLFDPLGRVLSITMFLNLFLFVLNLIPVPPLDGSSVASGLFPAARRLRDKLQGVGFLGVLAAVVLVNFIFGPIQRFVLGLLWA